MYVRVPNTIFVTVRQLMDNQKIENTLNFQGATAPGDVDVQECVDFVADWWTTNLVVQLSFANAYMQTYGYSRDTELGPQHTNSPATPINGSVLGDYMPNETALFVTFSLSTRGVEGRFGNFVSGIPKTATAGNYVLADWAGGVVGAYNLLRTSVLSSLGLNLVGVSTIEGGVSRAIGLTYPVNSCSLTDLVLDSQYKRKPGRGK